MFLLTKHNNMVNDNEYSITMYMGMNNDMVMGNIVYYVMGNNDNGNNDNVIMVTWYE